MGKMHKIGLLLRTVRYLKPIQIINRIKRKVLSIKVNTSTSPKLSLGKETTFYVINRPQSFLHQDEFDFLNRTEKLSFPEDWNGVALPKLWIYNLHYFEGLLNDKTPIELKQVMIEKWIEQNPVGYGNGWEPYPVSLRIVNWIKWHLSEFFLNDIALHSLAVQTRYLMQSIEYHLLGNHLFANAKALIFAGLLYEGSEADEWFDKGFKILKKQIPEQFLTDGAHFELSTSYHTLLTEDLLDIIQFMKFMNKDIPSSWEKTAEKAVNWLLIMTRPDGLSPLFNDAAYGITPSLEDILYLYNAVGLKRPTKLKSGMTDLIDSGYFRYEADNYSFFGDAGQIGPDYIPGHAHCDMLNFELFSYGKPVIVDTGTSTYEICNRRHIERSTVSHNTVQIGNDEQSEIWGAFRVARRAKITQRDISTNFVIAAYIGYKSPKVLHKRKFIFEDEIIIIEDEIDRSTEAIARLHFHPDIEVIIKNNIIEAGPLKIEVLGGDAIEVEEYEYAPEFNKLVPAKVLQITFLHHLTTKITL